MLLLLKFGRLMMHHVSADSRLKSRTTGGTGDFKWQYIAYCYFFYL